MKVENQELIDNIAKNQVLREEGLDYQDISPV